MSILRVDFTNVEEFEVMPTDIYPVVITGIEERAGKTSGLPYLNVEMAVTEGEYEGRKLWGMVSFSPKAAFKVKEFLVACGVSAEELEGNYDVEPEDYIGIEILASVIVDQYNGKENNKVESFLPLSDGPAQLPVQKAVKGKAPVVSAKPKSKFK